MSIRVQDVSKRFGNYTALDNVSLEVPEGTLLALLGPSGSGKTTLLRIIAGLEFPDQGIVLTDEDDVTRKSVKDRNVGFVFQHYALFKHMTVFENVAFGLRVRNWREMEIRERVSELLELIRLDELGHRYPAELSGGQRQRVALARALAASPRVLLLDEPFGALDSKVRQELRRWLRRLHDELPVTTLFVTHDQEEAFEVADRVVVMNQGRIEQDGSPQEIFESPANAFVMDFIGQVNVFHGRIHDGKAILGTFELDCPQYLNRPSGSAQVYIRPHELDIDRTPNGKASMPASVLYVNPVGAVTRVQVMLTDLKTELRVDLPLERSKDLGLKKGDSVFVAARRVRVFVPEYAI